MNKQGQEQARMTWLDLVTAIAALWRLTSLAVDEDGPGDVLLNVRKAAGIQYNSFGLKTGVKPNTYLAGVLDCSYCFSVNAGAVLGVLWVKWPNVARLVSLPLALSAFVVWIVKLLEHFEGNNG